MLLTHSAHPQSLWSSSLTLIHLTYAARPHSRDPSPTLRIVTHAACPHSLGLPLPNLLTLPALTRSAHPHSLCRHPLTLTILTHSTTLTRAGHPHSLWSPALALVTLTDTACPH